MQIIRQIFLIILLTPVLLMGCANVELAGDPEEIPIETDSQRGNY